MIDVTVLELKASSPSSVVAGGADALLCGAVVAGTGGILPLVLVVLVQGRSVMMGGRPSSDNASPRLCFLTRRCI